MANRRSRGAPKYVTHEDLCDSIAAHGAVRGPRGYDGCDGKDGDEGPRGPMGPKGDTGKQGCKGERGDQGRRGERGLDGKDGCDGKDGRDGRDGDEGPEGARGPTGPAGADGKEGAKGEKGDTGAAGADGAQGPKGDKGDQGERGLQGEKGDKGDTGLTGPEGPQGVKGDQGEKGDKGDTGETGPTGPAGRDGVDGNDGSTVVALQSGTKTTLTIDGVDTVIDTAGGGGGGCCNTGVVSQPQADGSVIHTLSQSGGEPYSWTSPGGGSGTVGPKGDKGDPGADGADGADGSDGFSPTITTAMPNASTLLVTITDVNGTTTTPLDVGAGGSTGLTTEEAIDLIDARTCCITGITPVTNADGSITYTVNQTNGEPQSFTSPVPSGGGGGLTEAQVNELIDAKKCCITGVTSITNADGTTTYTIAQSNGESQTFTTPAPGAGGAGDTVALRTQADPNAPCVQQAVLTINGVDQSIRLHPYETPECCKCFCVSMNAGDTLTVQASSTDGVSVNWGDNDQVSDLAGGTLVTGTHQYTQAGIFNVSICQNEFCDDVTELKVSGYVEIDSKVCDGCS